MQNRYICYEMIVPKPVQAAVCAGFFNNLRSFQQPRAAFFLAVRMSVYLDLMMVLSLDLDLGWCWFRFGLSLVLWLFLYMACKSMHLHSSHGVPCRAGENSCQPSVNSHGFQVRRRAGRLRPPLTGSRISQAGASNPPLYYKVAATVALLASVCYTAEDAVDWFPALTA